MAQNRFLRNSAAAIVAAAAAVAVPAAVTAAAEQEQQNNDDPEAATAAAKATATAVIITHMEYLLPKLRSLTTSVHLMRGGYLCDGAAEKTQPMRSELTWFSAVWYA